MRMILLLAACGLFATDAAAVGQHSSQSMTCGAVRDLISHEGSAVLYYPSSKKPDLMLYNRFVSNMTPCIGMGQATTSSATVPTTDNPKCKVRVCAASNAKGPTKSHL